MLASELIETVAEMIADPQYGMITQSTWLKFLASAARDARNKGWLIQLEDDESLTAAATTYEYAVPATFAYVEKLLLESTVNGTSVYVDKIPGSHWEIRLNGAVPVFSFNTLSSLEAGKKIKVVGQKRPTVYSALSDEIDAGMESFMQERTLYYGFRRAAAGISELSVWRQKMAIQSWQTSEMMIRNHPQEFRALPSSITVPGRG